METLRKHPRQKTPHNTYKIPALPVVPISNPGIESIKAVLNPKKAQLSVLCFHK